MNGAEYTKLAMRTNDGKLAARLRNKMNESCREMLPNIGELMNGALGITGEAGEVADHIKKYVFHGHDLDRENLIKELGDVMWYVALIATALKVPLDEIMERNIEKLKKRYPEGFSEKASRERKENEEVNAGKGTRV